MAQGAPRDSILECKSRTEESFWTNILTEDIMLNHLLICGLGSIGMRHLRHFRALGVRRIDAYRTGKATIPEDKQNVPDHIYGSLEDALAVKPQAVVVCNPTAYHIITALAALRTGAHVLIEKPLSDRIDGVEQLQQVALTTGKKVAVAFNLRFHPIIMAAKEVVHSQVPLGTPLMMRAHFGSYLPDWHHGKTIISHTRRVMNLAAVLH